MPAQGTDTQASGASNPLRYGSFGKTHLIEQLDNRSKCSKEFLLDEDSGMSSEENDDSFNASVYNNNLNTNIEGVVTKCLTKESHSAVHWNEIPCCSKDVINSNVNRDDVYRLKSADILNDNEIINSEFIIIDLTCDVDDVRERFGQVGTNVYNVDCDNASILSVESSRSLVPVKNEIVVSENQKLVSLSLSILLAAILQAMRCFAQFLEDIVVPQRQ